MRQSQRVENRAEEKIDREGQETFFKDCETRQRPRRFIAMHPGRNLNRRRVEIGQTFAPKKGKAILDSILFQLESSMLAGFVNRSLQAQ